MGPDIRPRNWRIAVVGGGIAGASAAWFARQALGDVGEIVLVEQSPTLGGRIRMIEVAGGRFEAGAAVLHSSNEYLGRLTDAAALERVPPFQRKPGQPTAVGVWDGRRFAFRSSPAGWRTAIRLLWRYGRSPALLQGLVRSRLDAWSGVYPLLDQGHGFGTPAELFAALGLDGLARQRTYEFLANEGLSHRLIHEFVDGVCRVAFAQDGNINAVAGIGSLAGVGVAKGELYAIRDGNARLCDAAAALARAEVRTSQAVQEVAYDALATGGVGRYVLYFEDGSVSAFDAVIVATPLEGSGIAFRGIELPPALRGRREFQVVHVTLVAGRLAPNYFGLGGHAALPDTILTTERPAVPFVSICAAGHSALAGRPVYRLFSRSPLSEPLLASLFEDRGGVARISWQAFPVLRPETVSPPFRLAPGLYYASAFEGVLPAMEAQAVASRNVVNLLVRDLQRRVEDAAAMVAGRPRPGSYPPPPARR